MGGHWMLLTFTGFLLAGVLGVFLWWAYRRLLSACTRYYHRYQPLSSGPGQSRSHSRSASRSISPSSRKRGIFPSLFSRRGPFTKQDVEAEPRYELVPRDD